MVRLLPLMWFQHLEKMGLPEEGPHGMQDHRAPLLNTPGPWVDEDPFAQLQEAGEKDDTPWPAAEPTRILSFEEWNQQAADFWEQVRRETGQAFHNHLDGASEVKLRAYDHFYVSHMWEVLGE